MISPKTLHQIYKWTTVVGCFLMLLPFGQTFFWGNMYIYCMSYLVRHTGMNPTDQAPWILSSKIVTTALINLASGFLIRHTGKRPLLLCGIISTSASYFLTYLAVQKSNLFLIFTFGALMGIGDGFIFCVGVQMVVDWAGNRIGTFVAISRCGMYVGAIYTNAFVTLYVNPENKTPNRREGPVLYFGQDTILEKVPTTFIMLGSLATFFQVLGFILVRDKRDEAEEATITRSLVDSSKLYGTCEDDVRPVTQLKSHVGNETIKKGRDHATHSHRQCLPLSDSSSSTSTTAAIQPSSIKISSSSLSTLPPSSSSSSSSSSSLPLTSTQASSFSEIKQSADDDESSNDLTPRQMIATSRFYTLAFTFVTTTVTYVTINNYYKEFGQIWIADDFFLTKLGTVTPVATVFFSILWGALIDKFSIKNFFIVFNICLSLLGCLYCFSPRLSIWLFSVSTVIYGGMVSPLYAVYNSATAKLFGKTHFAANQGVIAVSSVIVCLALSPALQAIILNFGWDYVFLFPAFINFMGMIAVIVTDFKSN